MHCPAWGLQVRSAACQSESHWCVIWNCFLTSLWNVMRCSFTKHLLWKVHLKLELWRKDAFYPLHRWHWVLEQPRGQGGMEKSQGVMATQLFVLAGKNDSFQRVWWKYQIHVSESVQTSKYTKAHTSIFSPWLRRARRNNWNVDRRGAMEDPIQENPGILCSQESEWGWPLRSNMKDSWFHIKWKKKPNSCNRVYMEWLPFLKYVYICIHMESTLEEH